MEILELFNLGRTFKRYFELAPALFETDRDAVFRLRHQVYCEELGFEPVRSDGRETDEYDPHSLHCLLRNAETKENVGCIRLVLARPGHPTYPFPFEKTCAAALDRSRCDPTRIPRQRMAEVSRLAVIRSYRRRRGEEKMPVGVTEKDFGTVQQPRFPYVPLALYAGMIALAHRHEIDTLFVLTEPRLASHLGKLGIEIRQIGRAVEHRGLRIPSVMNVPEILRDMRRIFRPFYRMIDKEIDDALWLRK